jgi:hypothetical protein
MKDQILKIAGVKSEKEFYKKYPTEEAFMAKHGKKLEKLAMGKAMVNRQLEQLTDFSNPPIAQSGGIFNVASAFDAFKTVGKDASGNATAIGGIGDVVGDLFGGKQGGAAGIMKAGKDVFSGGLKSGLKNLGTKGGLSAMGKAGGLGLLNSAGDILKGVGQMKEQKNQIAKADTAAQVSGLTKQAATNKPVEIQKHNFARPEDALVQPGQLGAPQGTGSNFLQMRAGGEIQNTYAPNTLYTDLQDIPTAEFGDYFQSSGQASIGKGVGSAVGSIFGPLGSQVGGMLGTVAGNLLGGAKDANKLASLQKQAETNAKETALAQGLQGVQSQNAAFMEQGGWVSHDWQPQVIATFGEHKMSDLLKSDPMMNTLRAGGHLKDYTAPSAAAMFTGKMEDGGYMAMGGNLQTHWGGRPELMSYNPYIPGGGETVMFRGQSHDETNSKGQSGIGITYGDNPVEVERGEPMTEMNDGGVVYGNMKIDEFAADQINDPEAKGKKYKNYVADLSKIEAKQNKILDKASELVLDKNINNAFDQLTLNSSQASIIGANMKLKDIAQKKLDAAAVQNAILETAEERGLVSDELAQGKIKQAKFGADLDKAQSGFGPMIAAKNKKDKAKVQKTRKAVSTPKSIIPEIYKPGGYNTDYDLPANFTPGITPLGDNTGGLKQGVIQTINQNLGFNAPKQNIDVPFTPGYKVPETMSAYDNSGNYYDASGNLVDQSGELPGAFSADQIAGGKGKYDWKTLGNTAMSVIAPILRPTNQMPLDPSQLMPEYYALATNQLEPVQAQKFQPLLQGAPSDISYQDQLNEITAQSRVAERMSQYNPEAAAAIFANVSQAKNKVLAEQFRANQARKEEVYAQNRNLLNDAQLKNLQILDQQYVRQAEAKSNTKAQALEALKSIAQKTAQNKLENRTLGVYENMYKYRFDNQGRAFSYNDPYQFNIPDVGNIDLNNLSEDDKKKLKSHIEKTVTKDKAGNVTGSKEKTSTTTGRNGSIVKAIKNL